MTRQMGRQVMRAFLLVLLLWCGFINHAEAQGSAGPSTWAVVMALGSGHQVTVNAKGGRRVRRSVRNVEAEALVLHTAQGIQIIPRSDVLTAANAHARQDSGVNGAAIGGLAGLIYGAVMTAAIEAGGESGEPVGGRVLIPLVSTGTGSAIGALIDRAVGRVAKTIIYRAPRP